MTWRKLLLTLIVLGGVLLLDEMAQAQTAHSVTLTWIASPDATGNPSLTYNVYRSVSTCTAATTFTKLNTTPVSALTFIDPAITVSGNYCYAVTAVLNGAESVMSIAVDATVRPSPPTSVKATVT